MRNLDYRAAEQLFQRCPFCGENVNVFVVPDPRYGKGAESWVVECRNMGCIFQLASTYHQFYSENPAKFEETKKEMAADGKPLPDWFKPEHIDPKPFKISPTKDLIFGTGLQSAETSAGLMNGMTWNFLTTTEEKPFITSDNPLCHLTFENGELGNKGLAHPNVRVFVPLSSTMALSAEWEKGHEYLYLEVEESLVQQVNLRTMANSDRFIVASRRDFPGVQHLATMIRQ